ncbi:MAG: hypothetical protein U1E08_05615 [Coriobacteriia bacterium]|nr:hypothetical protein [Actinomycetota bacterium]MDZ4167151.1 hypothetical protein [Coriobacteriia bacterium]
MSENSEEVGTREPAPSVSESEAGDASTAWREVVVGLESLGEAIGRWAKAAVNDPDTKRRADELSSRLDGFMSDVSGAVKEAAGSDVGQSFREAADKTGEAFAQAGERLSEEVGPRLTGALKSAAERLGRAAERMEERVGRETEQEPVSEPPTNGDAGDANGS